MNNVIPIRPDDRDPTEVWRGVADVNRAGIALAVEMLEQLEDSDNDERGIRLSDYACLEDWPRQGSPVPQHCRRVPASCSERGPRS
jgi:hypothetical protein